MPVTHEVEAKYVVKDQQAMAAFGRLAKGAERINKIISGASRALGGVASVAGVVGAALSFEKVIETTREHMQMVERISALSQTNVRTADALVDTFEQVGVKGEDAEHILLMMGRRSATMEMSMGRIGRMLYGVRGMYANLNIQGKGVEGTLTQMSKLYTQHKLTLQQIGMSLGVNGAQLMNLERLLKQGPEKIKEMVREGKQFGLGEGSMQAFQRMRDAGNQMAATWKRIQVIVGTELFPVIADLMESGAQQLKSWLPEVRKFGEFLRDNLHMALSIVTKIGKVLLANYALMKMTGTGMVGWAGKGLSFVQGGLPGAGGLASRVLSSAVGMGLNPAAAGGMMPAMTAIVRVMSVVGRLSLIGVAVMVAWKAFEAIKNNALGIRDTMLSFWKRLQGHFGVIAKLFSPVAKLFGPEGAVGRFFTVVIVTALDSLMEMVDRIMQLVETIIIATRMAFDNPRKLLHPIDLLGDAVIQAAKMHRDTMRAQEDERRARKAADLKTPGSRDGPPNFDFRNSRFDITQKFEEGYDPDRIALAFSNDLANLGEKKLQSGFAPLFSVR